MFRKNEKKGGIMKIGIYVFSGTGNTLIAAELLAGSFRGAGADADVIKIENHTKNKSVPNLSKYDMIGIGYAVHAFDAPRPAYDFMRALPESPGKRLFLFKSAGDFFWNGGSSSKVRSTLAKKGFDVFHETLFVMPANVFMRYPDPVIKNLYTIAEKTAGKSAGEILSGARSLAKNGIFKRIFTRLFSDGESFGVKRLGRHMKVSSECNMCGVCWRDCPTGNITQGEARPIFDKTCCLCMRCIHHCPKYAITPLLKFFRLKVPYNLKKIAADKTIPDDALKNVTKGFFRRFRRYFEKQGLL
jgi:flavodoxin/ferredoxin